VLIFILPSKNAGTLEEIGMIVSEEQLERTVFIMPPSRGYTFESDIDVEATWSEARNASRRFRLHLPEHRATGGLFQLDNVGRLRNFRALPVADVDQWREVLQALVDV
jgi:hypothetical protein